MKKLTGRRKAVQEHTRGYEACTEKIKIIPSVDFLLIIGIYINPIVIITYLKTNIPHKTNKSAIFF